MRLIDAEKLETELRMAIAIEEGMIFVLGKNEFLEGEIEAYKDILNGLKNEPTVEQEVQEVTKDLKEGDIFMICPICKHKVFVTLKGKTAEGTCKYCGVILKMEYLKEPITPEDEKKAMEKLLELKDENVESRPTTLHKGFE